MIFFDDFLKSFIEIECLEGEEMWSQRVIDESVSCDIDTVISEQLKPTN